jgi:hypothetical protein
MAKWQAEADPWLHSYAQFDWLDTWNRINISASASEIDVTIVDHPSTETAAVRRAALAAAPSQEIQMAPATHTGGGTTLGTGAATGVWVIKVTAQPGPGYSKPTVRCNGTADDTFRVLAVTAGSPQDPLKGNCKRYHVDTQNILQVSSNNGSSWSLADTNTTVPGALDCGNDKQKVASATFGPFCSTITAPPSRCLAQGPRCVWMNGHCADAPPPAPPPSWWHPFTVGQSKFAGTNMLCELDAPSEYFIDEATHTLYFFPPVPLEQWTEGPYINQKLFATNVSGMLQTVVLRSSNLNTSNPKFTQGPPTSLFEALVFTTRVEMASWRQMSTTCALNTARSQATGMHSEDSEHSEHTFWEAVMFRLCFKACSQSAAHASDQPLMMHQGS